MGCFGVPRWHETAGNKEKQEEKDKEIEKEETENTTKTATLLWRVFWVICHYKTGHVLRFLPFSCPQIEVTAICIYKGPSSCYRALGSPYGAIGSLYRPSVPLTGALSNSLVAELSVTVLGFDCIGPGSASMGIGLGRSYYEYMIIYMYRSIYIYVL